ncbi:hypothetical protein [Nonlabens ulvanivorans]|uniref:hypothetical protein n=1 Tax=Nonlabens ulvanivorans TaxID=906888 RepID=UPI0037C72E35
MGKEKLTDIFNKYPETIESPIKMDFTNQAISIYEGEFALKLNDDLIHIDGKLEFRWFPSPCAVFMGNPKANTSLVHEFFKSNEALEVIIDNSLFGLGRFIRVIIGPSNSEYPVQGNIIYPAVEGERSKLVDKIVFSVPNFGDFIGKSVRKVNKTQYTASKARLSFECDDYKVCIDRCFDVKERLESLSNNGGYLILSNGSLEAKKGKLSFDKVNEVMLSLSTFLTFLLGKRTSTIFRIGFENQKEVWKDYSNYLFDDYYFTTSWMPRKPITGFDELWKIYRALWENENDRDFLQTAIHWYIEANTSKFHDTALVNAQAALELIYNWWVVENKQLIMGSDSDKISAANKIRLIVSQLQLKAHIPTSLTNLSDVIRGIKDVTDGPDAITYIRNAIVHSRKKNREKLIGLSNEVKLEARELSLYYIELSLLEILEYKGTITDRMKVYNNGFFI